MTNDALRHGTWVSPELNAFTEHSGKFYVKTAAMADLLLVIRDTIAATYERFI